MFDATCADCGDTCKVPFQPNSDKPVFCRNCFGDKKNAGGRDERNSPALQDKFEEINAKLDRILGLLSPVIPSQETEKPIKVATPPSSGGKKKTAVKKSPLLES
ncbi:hypothetical protein HYS96_02215 [Candidatus Daviesbacteria bacterium]|nr:hypothetical protein [Candidatus Daviesbacteria bacterium]